MTVASSYPLMTPDMNLNQRGITILFIIALVPALVLVPACSRPTDQQAYEEVVATMSAQKAKAFFDRFPESRYRERLALDLVEWCGQDNSMECYRLIVDVLPKEHPERERVSKILSGAVPIPRGETHSSSRR